MTNLTPPFPYRKKWQGRKRKNSPERRAKLLATYEATGMTMHVLAAIEHCSQDWVAEQIARARRERNDVHGCW